MKTEKLARNCVLYVLSRILDRVSDRIRLAILIVRSVFGERYLDPFCFSSGVSFSVVTMLSFSDEKTTRHFHICIDVSAEKMAFFSDKSRPKLNKGDWSVSTIFLKAILKKRQPSLHASRKMAGGTSRKAGPILPFPCSDTPAKVLKPRFPKPKPVCHKRWP